MTDDQIKQSMKTLFKVSLVLLLISLYSILMESCICRDVDEYKIVDLNDLKIRQVSELDLLEVDTINGIFTLQALAEMEIVAAAIPNLSLMSSAYALSCDYETVNPFVESSLRLSFDKDFTFDNQIIPANSNILELEGLDYQAYEGVSVYFYEDFINKADFDNTEYIFKMTVETEDGLSFVLENGVVMDL